MPATPDLDLARQLEGAEAAASRSFCETAATVHPGLGIRALPCGGGVALFYGPADPLNAVKGVGLNGPVNIDDWNAVEEFHKSTNSPVVIDLCPLADAAFVAMLGERGYRIGSFETVTFRDVGSGDLPDAAAISDCRIMPPPDPAAWGRVLELGFADGGEPVRFAVDIGRVRERLPDACSLLATVDGKPAGGAAMSIQGPVAHLSGAAVLPEFRRRGIQRALTAARLKVAREHGCSLVKLDVLASSASHRNAVRAGFTVAYTRPQMVRTWA